MKLLAFVIFVFAVLGVSRHGAFIRSAHGSFTRSPHGARDGVSVGFPFPAGLYAVANVNGLAHLIGLTPQNFQLIFNKRIAAQLGPPSTVLSLGSGHVFYGGIYRNEESIIAFQRDIDLTDVPPRERPTADQTQRSLSSLSTFEVFHDGPFTQLMGVVSPAAFSEFWDGSSSAEVSVQYSVNLIRDRAISLNGQTSVSNETPLLSQRMDLFGTQYASMPDGTFLTGANAWTQWAIYHRPILRSNLGGVWSWDIGGVGFVHGTQPGQPFGFVSASNGTHPPNSSSLYNINGVGEYELAHRESNGIYRWDNGDQVERNANPLSFVKGNIRAWYEFGSPPRTLERLWYNSFASGSDFPRTFNGPAGSVTALALHSKFAMA